MASANKTPNLNLPQWVGTEKPERTDFNAAFDAIDTTVASHLADETQYEAVLINGFTGSVKYSKDAHGNVKLSITIEGLTTTTANTQVCIIPQGYRPSVIIPIPVNRSNSAPYTPIFAFYLTPTGALAIVTGATLAIKGSGSGITGEVCYRG